MRKVLIVSVFVLVVTACSAVGESGGVDTREETLVPVVGACAPDTPDCNDTLVAGDTGDEPLFIDDEPRDGVAPGSSSGMVVGGGLSVGEALTTDVAGVIAVHGFAFSDADGVRLCDVLAASLPPQCGGDTIGLASLDGIDRTLLQESQGVQWTNEHVTLVGEIVDGVLVVDPLVGGQIGTVEARTVEVAIYLLGGPDADPGDFDCSGSVVAPVARSVQAPDLLAGAIEALLEGPTDDERLAGYDSWFSAETGWTLESVTISDGVAHIDFGEDSPLINNASTSCGSMSFLAQLDSTAIQFPTVDRAVYSFGGDADAFYGWLQRTPPDM